MIGIQYSILGTEGFDYCLLFPSLTLGYAYDLPAGTKLSHVYRLVLSSSSKINIFSSRYIAQVENISEIIFKNIQFESLYSK